jgi:hypothetical protein
MQRLHPGASVSESYHRSIVWGTYVCSVVAALAVLTSGCQITADKGRLIITDVPPPVVESGKPDPIRPTEELTAPEKPIGSE